MVPSSSNQGEGTVYEGYYFRESTVCISNLTHMNRYLEVRFSPVLHIDEGLSYSAVMDAVCEGLEMAEYHLPITARVSTRKEKAARGNDHSREIVL